MQVVFRPIFLPATKLTNKIIKCCTSLKRILFNDDDDDDNDISESLYLRVRSFEMIRDYSDHGRSNEPMNPCSEWIHWFI